MSQVFISYSHQDNVWKDRLVGQLQVLQNENLFSFWVDDQIQTGDDWLPEIKKALQNAKREQTSQEFGGHALALNLLGSYLATVHNGEMLFGFTGLPQFNQTLYWVNMFFMVRAFSPLLNGPR